MVTSHSSVIQSFDDRGVRIFELGVLSDETDGDLLQQPIIPGKDQSQIFFLELCAV